MAGMGGCGNAGAAFRAESHRKGCEHAMVRSAGALESNSSHKLELRLRDAPALGKRRRK